MIYKEDCVLNLTTTQGEVNRSCSVRDGIFKIVMKARSVAQLVECFLACPKAWVQSLAPPHEWGVVMHAYNLH